MLLGVQVLIWIFLVIYLFFDYKNITKQISKTEEISIQIATWNKLVMWKIRLEKNTVEYNWKLWYLFSWYVTQNNWILSSLKKDSKIDLDIDLIKNTMYLNYLLNDNIIDIWIYDEFLFKDINDFNSCYQNLSQLSKYFQTGVDLRGIWLINSDLQSLQELINKQDHRKIVLFLKDLEIKIKSFYDNQNLKTKIISPNFIHDQEFNYLINTIFEDKNWYFKEDLNKVADIYWIDKNLILAWIVTEQLRWFYTYRWIAKDLIKTNRYIMNMYDFSLGIGWIKESAARQIEADMLEYNPDIYNKFFAVTTWNVDFVRKQRLTDTENYFYQFLYAGWLIYNIQTKRKKAGYDISNQPWIIMTLYNFGNPKDKKPNPFPKIGGSIIRIDWVDYTFGSLWEIVYYYFRFYMK